MGKEMYTFKYQSTKNVSSVNPSYYKIQTSDWTKEEKFPTWKEIVGSGTFPSGKFQATLKADHRRLPPKGKNSPEKLTSVSDAGKSSSK